jgi:signal transduction histidine kinase/ActR/RegA family two-component response regulator
VRNGERVPPYETERIDKTGTRIPVSVSLSAIRGAGGSITGLAAVCRDLTEWRRLEEQYRQAQKMEAVGRLAGGVAHDFNNILTVVNGFSELVIDALPRGDANREFVREVRRAGERAAGLTRQLLAFSRRQVLHPQVLDVNAVVTNLVKMLGRLLGEDVALEADLRRGVGPILADPGQIEQVLLNLSVNARDAMPTGGRLTIRTADAEVTADHAPPGIKPGQFVVLTVSDTGTGMTDEVKAHIFEPFFTTKEVGQGTGLGLATVHGIVEQSGGFVGVESRLGEGTTFRVYLPRTAKTGGCDSTHGVPAAARGTETVLLVEDEPAVRALAARVLRQSGYTVLEAEGSREAVAAAQAHRGRLHLLVTDVVMPGQGGRSLAERLRAADPKLKVLFMSGYTDDAIVHHGIRTDRVHFLQKPFTPLALAATVREILDAPDAEPE